ncbi:arylalkylamine N-acetyltransferase-like 2 [Leptinotarsa decemlineata]|uniref:arylalkylamine N-acetyltransferase-like 2 n=1 Tax=Leptinotarsa decemlineata TaxID=7539 RepID=UPI003D30ABF2
MSRRYRLEEERAKQATNDLQDEIDKMKLQKERIFGPLIWRRLTSGFRIQDLKPQYYEQVLDMIIEHFIHEDVVLRNSNFAEDTDSIKSFREKLLHTMKDQSSIIAIDESNEEIAGVLLLKAVKKCDFGRVFSRVQLSEGKIYQSVIGFMNFLNRKVDVFEHYQCEVFLRYYLLCINPEYRRKALGWQLMDTGLDIARHLKIPVIMAIMDCCKLQKMGQKLGMETLFEIEYVKWRDKYEELIFCDPGAGNYTCALMAGRVKQPVIEEPTEVPEDLTSKTKLTRAEKRKAKQKGKK